MIIDTEKDCGIWVHFKDDNLYTSWASLEKTGDSTKALVDGISAIMVTYLSRVEGLEPRDITAFYARIMDGVVMHMDALDKPSPPLKLVTGAKAPD